MGEAPRPARRSAAGADTRAGRAVHFGVEAGTTGSADLRAPASGPSVYAGRALRPLRQTVGEAIGLPLTGEVDPDDPDWSALWRRPELAGRLVQAFADHAVGCRAGRIVAPSAADRDLAAAVAARLALPLVAVSQEGGERPGPRDFLVARMLHDRDTAGIGRGPGPGPDPVVGAAAVLGIDDDGSPGRKIPNILSVIELSRSI